MNYSLNDRTSLRFGDARCSSQASVDIEGGINLNDVVPYPGFQQESFPLPALRGVPQARPSDPSPNKITAFVGAGGTSLGRYTELGSTAASIIQKQNLSNSYNDRFSFSIQRQVLSQIVVDFTYFLSFGFNQRYIKQLNNIDPRFGYEYKDLVNNRVSNPFYQILTPDKFPRALRNQITLSVHDLLRPYPQYNAINQWFAEGVYRQYQAFQFKAQRPFVKGFNFLVGYNYNRAKGDEYYDGVDTFLDNLTLQPSPNNRHKFNAGGIYELPFGKGRRYFSGTHRVVDGVLG